MKRSLSLIVLCFAACATVPPAKAPAPTPAGPVHLVIVGTSDVHGWFAGHDETTPDKRKVHTGGLAIFASYVNALRAANPGRVILVDSGDLFQGTMESNFFEGEPVVAGFNAIGYNAAAVGNHEFDYGPVGPDAIPRTPSQDPLGALKKNAAMAKFPFLSANMIDNATHETPLWAKSYTIVEAGGAKVGIIGLSTPDTPNVTMSQNVESLEFIDPVTVTLAASNQLHKFGVDAIVVIAHMGGRCKVYDQDPHDPSSCEVQQEAMHYLSQLPPGTIDAYFGGHTHSTMRHYINGVPALQAGAYSNAFAALDLWVDPVAHRVLLEKTELRPITEICAEVWSGTAGCEARDGKNGIALAPRVYEGRTIVADAKVAKTFEPYLEKVNVKRNEPTGIHTTAQFRRSYQHESDLGDILADALKTAMQADIAFVNSGGIRSDLRAGDLVYADIFEVCPFDNFPSTVMLTGAQIVESLRLTSTGERGVLQVSGLRYIVDWKKDSQKKISEKNRLVSVKLLDGSFLDPDKLYKVAMPDFLAMGGDGLQPVMTDVPANRIKTSLDKPLRDVIIPPLRALPQPLTPKTDGRITVLNDQGDKDR